MAKLGNTLSKTEAKIVRAAMRRHYAAAAAYHEWLFSGECNRALVANVGAAEKVLDAACAAHARAEAKRRRKMSKTELTFDAQTWAKAFNETLVELGYQPHDEGWLIGWFANAIMRGYDEAEKERK